MSHRSRTSNLCSKAHHLLPVTRSSVGAEFMFKTVQTPSVWVHIPLAPRKYIITGCSTSDTILLPSQVISLVASGLFSWNACSLNASSQNPKKLAKNLRPRRKDTCRHSAPAELLHKSQHQSSIIWVSYAEYLISDYQVIPEPAAICLQSFERSQATSTQLSFYHHEG